MKKVLDGPVKIREIPWWFFCFCCRFVVFVVVVTSCTQSIDASHVYGPKDLPPTKDVLPHLIY